MPCLAIEINDAGLVARGEPRGRTASLDPSPGYALLDGARILTGAEAHAKARLKPRRVNNKFWRDLDTAPLPRPFSGDMSHADLAHAHLASLWEETGKEAESVLLALPGTCSDRQMGLVLGIARALQMPVEGMVDAAVAAAATGYPGRRLLHLDIQLHRTVVTELQQGAEIVRRRVEVNAHAGIASLRDRWAKLVAELLVMHTRFDPLHSAGTEQDLFAGISDLVGRLDKRERALFEMRSGSKHHSVEVTRPQLIAAVDAGYQAMIQTVRLMKRAGEPVTILLSSRAAALPGLAEQLASIPGTEVVSLAEDAAVQGALSNSEVIRSPGEELPFLTRLPLIDGGPRRTVPPATAPAATPAPAREGRPPTHLLHDGTAWPVNEDPFRLGVAVPGGSRGLNLTGETAGISRDHCLVVRREGRVFVEDHSTYGTLLNGQRVAGEAELNAGDTLLVGSPGIEILLIEVAD